MQITDEIFADKDAAQEARPAGRHHAPEGAHFEAPLFSVTADEPDELAPQHLDPKPRAGEPPRSAADVIGALQKLAKEQHAQAELAAIRNQLHAIAAGQGRQSVAAQTDAAAIRNQLHEIAVSQRRMSVAAQTESGPLAGPAAPVARPAVAAPVARPAVAAPVARPAVAAPVARPAVAAPVARPAVAAPSIVSTPLERVAASSQTQSLHTRPPRPSQIDRQIPSIAVRESVQKRVEPQTQVNKSKRHLGRRLRMMAALSGMVAISAALAFTPLEPMLQSAASASTQSRPPATKVVAVNPISFRTLDSVSTPAVAPTTTTTLPTTTTTVPTTTTLAPLGTSTHAIAAMQWALKQVGTPYVWGGAMVGGFDCSGLVQAAYATVGVTLPRVAQAQFYATPSVSTLQPGDLVFFGSSTSNISHVGIYVGNGQMVDAPHAGADVRVESFPTVVGQYWGDEQYLGATRVA